MLMREVASIISPSCLSVTSQRSTVVMKSMENYDRLQTLSRGDWARWMSEQSEESCSSERLLLMCDPLLQPAEAPQLCESWDYC